MSTKGKRPFRSLTPSDKIVAIQRIHDGESKASVARAIGVPESTLRGWCKNEEKLRFAARHVADKFVSDDPAEKLDSSCGMIGVLPEKRQKLDTPVPLNYSGKTNYEELAYKRLPLNGLNYNATNFNGVVPDYSAFDNTANSKMYGTEISRQALAALSPLSSLSHLSGNGMTNSALGYSFFAQFGGINGLGATENTLRNIKPKTQPLSQTSRSEGHNLDSQQGLSVKNWAKQKTPATSTLSNGNYSLHHNDGRNKIKYPASPCPSMPSSLNNIQSLQPAHDVLVQNLFKSQQALAGLNNIYTAPSLPSSTESHNRPSTPQRQNHHSNTPPIPSTALPSVPILPTTNFDQYTLMLWCRMLAAAAAANAVHQQPPTSTTIEGSNCSGTINEKTLDNILYSHLTKDSGSPSMHSSSSIENIQNNSSGEPEDLSTKSTKTATPSLSSIPASTHSNTPSRTQSPIAKSPACDRIISPTHRQSSEIYAACKGALENALHLMNNNQVPAERGIDSDTIYANEKKLCENRNINHSNKANEEERATYSDHEVAKAIEHGEKFLKCLENFNNPRVTTVQLMELRTLISDIKSGSEIKMSVGEKTRHNNNNASELITESDENVDESSRK